MLGFSKYLQVVCVSNAVSSEYCMSSFGQNPKPDQIVAGPVYSESVGCMICRKPIMTHG